MAALVKVTDSLSGKPVIVNMDMAQTVRRYDNKTVIQYEHDKVCCTETPTTIFNAVLAQKR